MDLIKEIPRVVREAMDDVNRPDLFRDPICGFSSASDSRYEDLKTIIGPWHLNPKELMPESKTVISYFVPFTKEVSKSPKCDEAPLLWGEAYEELNKAFDFVGQRLIAFLREQGYEASGFAATHTFDPKVLRSPWSHRSAAVISGLGTFGLNRMVITEKGSAGRFCTVFTSAEITPSPMPTEEYCFYHQDGRCGACVKNCPTKALSKEQWLPFACYDLCLKNAEALKNEVNFADVCGKCIGVCPRRYME